MKAIFWQHPEHKRERDLALAVAMGAKACGDEVQILDVTSGEPEVRECDLVMKVGVKSRDWFKAYRAAGISYCYFDKGYIRTRSLTEWLEYWRMSVNGHQPVGFIEKARYDCNRAVAMGLGLLPWQHQGKAPIVVDGSSAKHWFFNSDEQISGQEELDAFANAKCRTLVAEVRDATNRPIIFRPKPSWPGARPIDGTEWARKRPGVDDKDCAFDLRRAHAVVTYGSNLCFDAVCFGVPAIILGDGIARPISSTSLREIENPRLATDAQRRQWLNNCAWCQFKLEEFRSGMGWKTTRTMMASCTT